MKQTLNETVLETGDTIRILGNPYGVKNDMGKILEVGDFVKIGEPVDYRCFKIAGEYKQNWHNVMSVDQVEGVLIHGGLQKIIPRYTRVAMPKQEIVKTEIKAGDKVRVLRNIVNARESRDGGYLKAGDIVTVRSHNGYNISIVGDGFCIPASDVELVTEQKLAPKQEIKAGDWVSIIQNPYYAENDMGKTLKAGDIVKIKGQWADCANMWQLMNGHVVGKSHVELAPAFPNQEPVIINPPYTGLPQQGIKIIKRDYAAPKPSINTCTECGGRGKIELFISISNCKSCGGTGMMTLATKIDRAWRAKGGRLE